jgi:hypothetical protein
MKTNILAQYGFVNSLLNNKSHGDLDELINYSINLGAKIEELHSQSKSLKENLTSNEIEFLKKLSPDIFKEDYSFGKHLEIRY